MAFLPSLDDRTDFKALNRRWPYLTGPVHALSKRLYNSKVVSKRDAAIIFTYCAGLNGCSYCYTRHSTKLERAGVPKAVMEALLRDIDSAPVEEKLKPVLKLCKTLTLQPSRVTQAEVDAVLAAGWGEKAYYVIVSICAQSNYITRITSAHGLGA